MTESFWALPDMANIRTPATILKEQAEALTRATEGKLRGEVGVTGNGITSNLSLYIRVPYINDYRVTLLSYQHDLVAYPGNLYDKLSNNTISILGEERFVAALRDILSSEKTRMVLGNLLSQVDAA